MRRIVCAAVLSVLRLVSPAAENSSALEALKVLPKEEIKNLARIEAYDGTPLPERWHFLLHDSNVESGLREYVVAEGELIVTRGVSQFAERLNATDVIGSEALEVDSDKLAQLAKQYAAVNDARITKVSYHLYKRSGSPEPLWQVNCYNGENKAVGALVVNATNGSVVAHDGFALRPQDTPKGKAALLTSEEWETESEGTPAQTRARTSRKLNTAETRSRRKTASAGTSSSSERKSDRSAPRRKSSERERVSRSRLSEIPPPMVVRERRNPIRNFFRRFAR
ncbi:MAG: hypothetical protein EOP84_28230 [Verrucomicrobiaceae bacterium]|nr:MAG: hypothetical protein EOP84_28230 [Verrucomicrobiaceae bacterium]